MLMSIFSSFDALWAEFSYGQRSRLSIDAPNLKPKLEQKPSSAEKKPPSPDKSKAAAPSSMKPDRAKQHRISDTDSGLLPTTTMNNGEPLSEMEWGILITIDLKRDGVEDLTDHFHHLPCCIKSTGPASVSHYFKPKPTRGVEVEGLPLQEVYFRGRKLDGTTIILPNEYRASYWERKARTRRIHLPLLILKTLIPGR